MIDALLWDNDGILVDTESLYLDATRSVLAEVGIDLPDALYRELFLIQGKGAWHLASARGLAPDEVARLRDERNARYSRSLRETPLVVDGVEEVLAAIHGRWRMGVVTSSRKDHFDLIHARTGLLKYFDFALTADDVDRVKPDPELYRLGVARIGSGADRCVAIEDSERGLTAALEAGVRCIAVPSRLTRGTPFEGAAAVLDSIRGVPAALAALEHHGPLDLRS